MQDHVKQRLIGAITIISLAVIFLPLIFDGSGDSDLPGVKLDVPARPQLIFDQHFTGLPAGEGGVKQLREEIDLRNLNGGWVVQTGIFDDEDSAKAQVIELLRHGYKARRTIVNDAGAPKFVVEVGPERDKLLMADLAQRIEEDLKIAVTVKEQAAAP